MRAALATVAAAWVACASAPPPQPRAKAGPQTRLDRVVWDLPRLELATFAPETDAKRPWPLAELPSVQPHHDFAMARDLCDGDWAVRNARDHQLVSYGAAWCRVHAGDRGGITALATLARTARDDIRRPARLDVVNLVAAHDPAGALARLTELGLASADDLYLLAATLGALGMASEAAAVAARVIASDREPSALVRCERLLAWGTLDKRVLREFDRVPTDFAGRCAQRLVATRCAVERTFVPRDAGRQAALRECYREFADDASIEHRVWLLVAASHWPASTSAGWLAVARHAAYAIGIAGAELVAVTALDNAFALSACEPNVLREIAVAAARVAAHDLHQPQFDARLAHLRMMTESRCDALAD